MTSYPSSPHRLTHMVQVGDVIVSPDIFTECFCCDLDACHGQCCIDGDSGAPLNLDELDTLEAVLPIVENELEPAAQAVIRQQGVAYLDGDGDLVTSIVEGKNCVFTCMEGKCCLCAIDRAYRQGRTQLQKPMSCYLYPIREKQLGDNLVGLNYHRWSVCAPARKKGRELQLPLYIFLKEPLCRRFGEEWYQLLVETAEELKSQGMI